MLEVRGLTKRYPGVTAVDAVSFTVRPYEVLGYLGPNGSGKTTTMNMLTGLVEPTRAEILFRGRPITEDLIGYKRRLGYVPEEPRLYPFLTGREYLELVCRLRDLPPKRMERQIEGFLRLFSLWDSRHTPISSYSKGMKQKVLISAVEVVEKVCSHVVILHRGAMVANDSVERLRDLMALPSLEDIFSQLVVQEDTETIARGIVAVMKGA